MTIHSTWSVVVPAKAILTHSSKLTESRRRAALSALNDAVAKGNIGADTKITINVLDQNEATQINSVLEPDIMQASYAIPSATVALTPKWFVDVPSDSAYGQKYVVGCTGSGRPLNCSCPDYTHRSVNTTGYTCKHMARVAQRGAAWFPEHKGSI